jgi:hypothetical protein
MSRGDIIDCLVSIRKELFEDFDLGGAEAANFSKCAIRTCGFHRRDPDASSDESQMMWDGSTLGNAADKDCRDSTRL